MSECEICGGVGLVRVKSDAGLWVSRACECQESQAEDLRIKSARIPNKYRKCTLDSYWIDFTNAHESLNSALRTARKFVDAYPIDTKGKGLLFVGANGLGKTHLAVGVLQRLIRERGVQGLFFDYRELLKHIQSSYNPQVQATELEILRPILNAEVLIIDDIGTQKPTDWVWDTVAYVLNARYNGELSTIITTHFPALPAGKGQLTDPEKAAREISLGDRIGDSMLSRLCEMCIRVEMSGGDFRQSVKRASFGS
ncbi:ATP-binding protein [Telmatobacter sp. DSM 110680]|uniref:ATP-binding protein n=1 Tax=Telmatobacter sp. DSM 110680 TaxID=3036704 RepID=A0AAU7DQQ8_9BACT